ncbi:pyridoxal phosphate-dependent aminotransferase [Ornithinimicrobium panacihumi]|uniref:pyridoxal phosphate-dependent aminotransferase n=1 Tax=Ornithinimicrobium panacihumi TaxID=2008449 RepID=UPI003F89EDDF
MSPSSRVADVGLSPIRRMAVGAPPGTISLGLGEPGWALPQVAREALVEAGHEHGPLAYGPNTSSPDLVDAVSDHHAASHRIPSVDPTQVMVTSGSQSALCALFLTHVEAGSAVLVPDPGFVSYASLARMCQARSVGYPLGRGGVLDADLLVATLESAPDASVVVLNHPANPTGATASAADLLRVAEACASRGVLLISDEVYAELWLGAPPASLHDVVGVEGGIVLGSVSKSFGAPGLRVGWAVGDPEVLAPTRIVHNAMTTAPARPSQAAAVALLRSADVVLPAAREEVRVRWQTLALHAPQLLDLADRAAGRSPGDPRAGFYLWLPVPEEGAAGRAAEVTVAEDAGADTESFALRVRDESHVTTVPGRAFGPRGAGFLRVSIGGPVDELEQGLARLAPRWKA